MKFITTSLLILLVLIVTPLSVSARVSIRGSETSKQERIQEKRDALREELDKRSDIAWGKVDTNLGNIIIRWEEKREIHKKAYLQKVEKVQERLDQFESEDKDTTDLEAALKKYNNFVISGYTYMGDALNDLSLAQEAAKEKNKSDFANFIALSKEARQTGKTEYKNARDTFRNEIVPLYKRLISEK